MTGVIDPGMAGDWTLEPERSSVTFVARTLWGMAPVKGRFTAVSGEGHVTTGGKVSGRLVIQADSVRTGIGMRDRHLRAPDFFDAANHAEIVVEVTDIDTSGQLIATLTIRGITLPIPLQAHVDWLAECGIFVHETSPPPFHTDIAELIAQPDVDGALVGGASLDPDEFAKICKLGA